MNITALILIGASTGGPGRIYSILSSLDSQFEGTIIIAQHMSAPFIPSFVHQMQSITPLPIWAVTHPLKLERGEIYICSITSRLIQKEGQIWLEPMEEGDYPYNPQIDLLFSSASQLSPKLKRLGVILTGIGDDGALGSLSLYESGGDCLFESEESSIVYGMPRRAKELVCNGNVGSIDEIIERIKEYGGVDVRMV
ncbi:MAG TPA: CheB methylesterase domain-containing protein [Sulfuricurvum sp.]|nr:CheB methylesterase domain-containing protein [Sulfuricurvum sp.]